MVNRMIDLRVKELAPVREKMSRETRMDRIFSEMSAKFSRLATVGDS